MKSLKNIFHKKQKQEPKPLRVEGVKPAPMTPEPDDAELAAAALLEHMSEIKGASRNNDMPESRDSDKMKDAPHDAAYFKALAERIRKAHESARLRTQRFLAFCEQELKKPDLPKEGAIAVSGNAWAFGLAQLFTSVSPAITDEFEVAYMKRIFPYYGAIYYGCCDRLDDRLDIIAKLPKIRKISCSPWSIPEPFAEKMPDYCAMSVKPNPAFLAGESLDEASIRKEIRRAIAAAKNYNRSVEFILKDITTVRNNPQRLWRWQEIAMEEVQR